MNQRRLDHAVANLAFQISCSQPVKENSHGSGPQCKDILLSPIASGSAKLCGKQHEWFCDFFVVAVVSGSGVSWYLRTHTGFVRWPYNRGFLQNKLHICWLAWKSVHFSLYGESDSSLTCNTEIRGEVEWVEEVFELATNKWLQFWYPTPLNIVQMFADFFYITAKYVEHFKPHP